MHSGHQATACRRADGRTRVVLSEAKTFGRKTVHIRCGEFLLTITGQIAVPSVIQKQVDQVGFFALGSK